MLLSTQTEALGARIGDIEAIRIIAEAGFDAVDFSCFSMEQDDAPLNGAHYRQICRQLRDAAQDHGVCFNQAHAPFAFSWSSPQGEQTAHQRIARSMEIAALLGAPHIVVHPLHHWRYHGREEMVFEKNVAYYQSLVPLCQQLGVKVCVENMWQRDPLRNVIVDDVASRADEFARLLDRIDSPWVIGCLDLGHCGLVGENPADAVRTLGARRLRALHVHDNDLLCDSHQIPYWGKTDWAGVMRALAQIGYEGDFTFEADKFLHAYPTEFLPAVMKFLHDTGRMLIELAHGEPG